FILYTAVSSFPTRRSSDLAPGSRSRWRGFALVQSTVVLEFKCGIEAEELGRTHRRISLRHVLTRIDQIREREAVAGREHLHVVEDRKSTRLNSSHGSISYA